MHRAFSSFICVLVLCAAAESSAKPITIEGGLVADAVPDEAGVRAFKGIPYAAPPVGGLRWRAAEKVRGWADVRRSDRFGQACAQSSALMAASRGSEDCLYLNVWTPAGSGDGRLPVFVWIHGGAYVVGSGDQPGLDGAVLAAQGIVVVTLNYRLGALGFLAHPGLSAESPVGASGNYGILDQIAALRWVRANINRFGGDPDRVTISGHSAGATSVNVLVASPLARGLFARVVAMGGSAFRASGPGDGSPLPHDLEERKGVSFMRAVGARSIEEMRRVPLPALLAEAGGDWARWGWNASVDGYVLPRAPEEIFARGEQNDVPLLLGWNSNEGAAMGRATFGDDGEALTPQLQECFGKLTPDLLRLYPVSAEERAAKTGLAGDGFIGYPSWTWALSQVHSGRSPVFEYKFAHAPPVPEGFQSTTILGTPGAFHGAEAVYFFGTLAGHADWKFTAIDSRLAEQMRAYLLAFITSANPNRPGLPEWPAYTRASARKLYFDDSGAHAEPDGDFDRFTRLGAILSQTPGGLRYRGMNLDRWKATP